MFWNLLFYFYCFTLCQYLFNLPSFASTFRFISSGCIVIFFYCSFLFVSTCSSVFPLFYNFGLFSLLIYLFPVEFPILVLIFSSCFLRGYQVSHELVSLLHRVVHLIRLYYSLIYMLALDLFFRFLLTVLHSMFISDGKVVFFSVYNSL